MEYTVFGKTGLKVSKMGLGGAPLAGDFGATDEAEVQRVIHEAVDSGINFIDTAPLYGRGESERRIGRALEGGYRERVVLASKAARSDMRYDYKTIVQSVEDSLQRLRTDRLDLVQLHDVETQPFELIVEEAIPALEKLRDDGKVRFLGVSTRHLDLLMRYMRTGSFDSVQFYARYMLLDHTAKDALLPLARELNLGVINGSVLGMGILAETPAPFLGEETLARAREGIAKLDFLRTKEGPGGLIEPAMRFSFANPDIHVTLSGVATLAALRMNVALCDGRGLNAEDQAKVYELFQGNTVF
ncbi:aldo/keto reductase [Paenibacillus sp.]|uniref:aldo/keto reductase n=1 Tax=Paenibacillus sp. TaxID=58172 RepID=UPI002D6A8E18|nr:aldo/keto reductase [Paenibacillus sp.]HZG58784.1 aldo/keto reductase [Paenibacillus sp.]